MSYNLPFTKCLHPVKVKTLRGIQLVKCGKCPACENSLRSELRAKVQQEEIHSKFSFFITLTFDDEHLPLFCLRSDLGSSDDLRRDCFGNVINDGFYLTYKPVDYTDLWSGKKIHFDSTCLADNNVGFFPLPERIQTDNYNDRLSAWCVDSENSIYSRCILGKASEHYEILLDDYHKALQSNVAKCKQLGIANNSLSWYDYVDSNYGFSHSDCVPLLYYPDLQRFLKRLRKYFSKLFKDEKIRYYAIGEYGTSSYRPHWHILLFTDSAQIAEFLQHSFYENKVLSRQREQFTHPFFWIRCGNMVVILLIRQMATLPVIFQTMLLALQCSHRFLQNLLRKKPFTLSDLVARTQRAKSVKSWIHAIMNDSVPSVMLTLPPLLCELVPFGGRFTVFSSLSLLELTHSLMTKNIEYLRSIQN